MGALDSRLERVADIERRLAQHPAGFTTGELARHYGKNPSTISRDFSTLESLGTGLTRKGRRWTLDHRRSLYTLRLTHDEVLALFLAARLLSRHSDEHNPHVVKALEKLADALRTRSTLMARHVDLAAAAVRERRVRPEYVQAIETLGRAWAEGRKVRLTYWSYSKGETTERIFAPYFIEPSAIGFACHVIGHDELRGGIRTLKVERIHQVQLTDDRYSIPESFDPLRLLANAWGIIWSDEGSVEVTLRFSPRAAQRVQESIWHHSQHIENCPDGSCLFTVQLGSTLELTPWVRQWGADVEVLAPKKFRDDIAAEARTLAALYPTSSSPRPWG